MVCFLCFFEKNNGDSYCVYVILRFGVRFCGVAFEGRPAGDMGGFRPESTHPMGVSAG